MRILNSFPKQKTSGDHASYCRWMISVEDDVKFQEVEVLADNYAGVSDLLPCHKYIFFVSGVSPGGAQGSTETTTTVMDETGRNRPLSSHKTLSVICQVSILIVMSGMLM